MRFSYPRKIKSLIIRIYRDIEPRTWFTWILRLGGLKAGEQTRISSRSNIRYISNHKYGKNCIVNPLVTIWSGQLLVGDYVNINPGTVIYGKVNIGSYTMIGPNVMIMAGGHKHDSIQIPIRLQGDEDGEITIGEDTWLGAGCVILTGVEIGRGSIIGAGSVVTKSIPNYSIAVGNPAKVIRSRK